jgi:hypothetical protein
MTADWGVALLAALTVGCASGGQTSPQPSEATPDKGAIVVKGSDMSGNLLDGLRYRVPSMRVSMPPNECPRILFRGIRSIRNQANPSIYLDGTRMGDTCILQQLSASDVEFVELYPSGNTARTSYERNPFGLILVFRRQ